MKKKQKTDMDKETKLKIIFVTLIRLYKTE